MPHVGSMTYRNAHLACSIPVRMSVRAIARAPNVNAATMSHLRCPLEEIGFTANRPQARRPRVTTLAKERYIQIFHLRDHLRPAGPTADELVSLNNRQISPQTVRNRLWDANLRVHRPRRELDFTPTWWRQRLAWVRRHICWMLAWWRDVHVHFSDEVDF